ncbi:MAG: hypothetical protein J6S48_03115 [Bacteroidales bacterium]|nr:hypothetical protein [Bacteroidales bacterium]
MRKLTLAVLLLCNIAYGQTIYERFNKAINTDDTVQMTTLIRQIQASGDESPERYIAEFNYYYNMSKKEHIELSTELPKGNHSSDDMFTLTDSTGKPAGYMYSHKHYDPARSDSAIAIITKGIAAHPNRLDMRFGKIYTLGEYAQWESFADEVLKVLDYTEKHPNTWVYPGTNDPIDTIIIYSVLEYEKKLFDQCEFTEESRDQDAIILGWVRNIALKTSQIYPKDVFSLNIIAVTYNGANDYANAITWLKKAEQIAPKDVVVLSNLADTYHNMGDYANEKKYLKKILKYGDADAKEYARYYLKQLP